MFEVPEKLEAPEMVLMRGFRFGGIFHVVGSSTDMLSKDSDLSSQLVLSVSLFFEQQLFLYFFLALNSIGKHPPTMNRKKTRKEFTKRDIASLL